MKHTQSELVSGNVFQTRDGFEMTSSHLTVKGSSLLPRIAQCLCSCKPTTLLFDGNPCEMEYFGNSYLQGALKLRLGPGHSLREGPLLQKSYS
jgi:hypothetical protein